MTPGKVRGLDQASTEAGVFSVFAIDHRDSMRVVLDPDEPESVPDAVLTDLKLEFTQALAHESAAKHGSGVALYVDDIPEPPGILFAAFGLSLKTWCWVALTVQSLAGAGLLLVTRRTATWAGALMVFVGVSLAHGAFHKCFLALAAVAVMGAFSLALPHSRPAGRGAVIGAGAAGLAAARTLQAAGRQVQVVDAGSEPGGVIAPYLLTSRDPAARFPPSPW